MGFSEDMARTDGLVYSMLGDDILYKAAGTSTYLAIKGFPDIADTAFGIGEIDPGRLTRRVKVSRADVPTPSSGDRWQCATLLGAGTWSQTNTEPVVKARDWIIELQRASTNV